jgi:hypothetical protein
MLLAEVAAVTDPDLHLAHLLYLLQAVAALRAVLAVAVGQAAQAVHMEEIVCQQATVQPISVAAAAVLATVRLPVLLQ